MNLCFLNRRHKMMISRSDPGTPSPQSLSKQVDRTSRLAKAPPTLTPIMLTFMLAVEWVDIP